MTTNEIEEFIKEQARYAFSQSRRLKEIEEFCESLSYLTILEAVPLDWAPVGCVGYTLKGFVHRWLLDQISERITKTRVG